MKWKLIFSLIIVTVLIGLIVFIMSLLNIIHFKPSDPLGNHLSRNEAISSEDPFLLEKADLKKQWELLAVKETFINKKEEELKKESQLLQDKIQEINKQREAIENDKKAQEQALESQNSRDLAISSLATKVTGVPPQDGASMLNDMDPEVAVEVIKAIDKNAQAAGQNSSSSYIISLMDPAKRRDVVRMLAEAPSDVKPLNLDEQLAVPNPAS